MDRQRDFYIKINRFVKTKYILMNTWVIIGLIVIVLHLLVGFGWLIYKLSPRKTDKKTSEIDKDV